MCSTIAPDFRYDENIFKLNASGYNIMGILCVHKQSFQFFGGSDRQCLQCTSTCQVRNIPFEEQIKSFFWEFGQGIHIPGETQKSNQNNIGVVFCPERYCLRHKFVKVHTWKEIDKNWYECLQCKACCHGLNMPIKDHKPKIMLFGCDVTYLFVKKRVLTTKSTNRLNFRRLILTNCNQAQPNVSKKSKNYSVYGKIVSNFNWLIQKTSNSIPFSFYALSVYSKALYFCQLQ